MAEAENKAHVRADKATTYLASAGVVSTGLWALGLSLSFPLIGVGFGAGIIALSVTERGRDIVRKAGHQLLDLGSDLQSHFAEDLGRFARWMDGLRQKKEERKAASIDRAVSAFHDSALKPGFDKSAKPGAAVDDKPKAPAAKPAAAPKL